MKDLIPSPSGPVWDGTQDLVCVTVVPENHNTASFTFRSASIKSLNRRMKCTNTSKLTSALK